MHRSEVSTSILPELHDARQLLHELLRISSGCTNLLNAGSSSAQLLPTTSNEGLNLSLLSIGLQHSCVSWGQRGTAFVVMHLSAQVHKHLRCHLGGGHPESESDKYVHAQNQPAVLTGSKAAGARRLQQSAAEESKIAPWQWLHPQS